MVMDRRDRVLDGHTALDRLVEKPAHNVRVGGPLRGDLLARDHDQACALAALLNLFDAGHGVVVGDRDEVDVRFDRGFDQLGGRDHAIGRDGVAMRGGERHQLSKSDRMKASGSNGARSSMPSPTPASLTGTPSSDSIAMTAPPFALLSSLVSTRPVIVIARLNSRACTRLLRPSTASSTSSDS